MKHGTTPKRQHARLLLTLFLTACFACGCGEAVGPERFYAETGKRLKTLLIKLWQMGMPMASKSKGSSVFPIGNPKTRSLNLSFQHPEASPLAHIKASTTPQAENRRHFNARMWP